jgi:hypothetical protein
MDQNKLCSVTFSIDRSRIIYQYQFCVFGDKTWRHTDKTGTDKIFVLLTFVFRLLELVMECLSGVPVTRDECESVQILIGVRSKPCTCFSLRGGDILSTSLITCRWDLRIFTAVAIEMLVFPWSRLFSQTILRKLKLPQIFVFFKPTSLILKKMKEVL